MNECLDVTTACDQLRINSVGTYDCPCEEGYRIGSGGKTCICKSLWRILFSLFKLLWLSFCSSGARETTYFFTLPVLAFLSPQTEVFLFLLFSLLQFQLCACCSSPTFTIGLLKRPSQRLVPLSCPLLGCLVQTLSFLSWTLAQFYFLLPTCWSQAFGCVVLALDDDELEEEELEVVRFPGLLFRGLPLLLHYVATSLPPTYEREDRGKRT